MDLPLDRDGEVGEPRWPMILRNYRSASNMPAAVQRSRMSPPRQRNVKRWRFWLDQARFS